MTVKCLDELAKEKVVKSFMCGVKPNELAEIWNVSTRTIRRVLVEHNLLPPEGTRVSLSPDEVNILEIVKGLNLDAKQLKQALSTTPLTSQNIMQSLGMMPEKEYSTFLEIVSGVRAARDVVNAPSIN